MLGDLIYIAKGKINSKHSPLKKPRLIIPSGGGTGANDCNGAGSTTGNGGNGGDAAGGNGGNGYSGTTGGTAGSLGTPDSGGDCRSAANRMIPSPFSFLP